MTISKEDLTHLAQLASLSLRDDETGPLLRDLEAILRHVDELGTVDTSNVEATASVQLGASGWREDTVEPSLSNEDALSSAPKAVQGGFAVPTFVEA